MWYYVTYVDGDKMDSNKKIDLINAYRQLSGTTLKLSKGTTEEAASAVQQEFQAFVASRIEDLLSGNSQDQTPAQIDIPASQLTDEDIQVLLALVENVRSKQRLNEAANTQAVNQRRPQQPQVQVRGGSSSARPLKDPDPTGEKYRSVNESLLSSLAKMERDGPEY